MNIAKKYEDLVAERDAALTREAEVGRLYDSLVNRSNREREASYKREDALREELDRCGSMAAPAPPQVDAQHLTIPGSLEWDGGDNLKRTSVVAPEGFKLVPVEAAREQLAAGLEEFNKPGSGISSVYTAMIDYAPVPPQVEAQPVAWIKADVAATLTRDECCYAFGSQNPKGSLIPLFTHSDAGEVERLRESERKCIASADAQHLRAVNAELERDNLRAQLAKMELAFKKLRDVAHGCYQIASSYSGCIDGVEEHGGDDHEDPSCAIHHRLYYAMFDADAALSATKEGKGDE